ncbi:unnamed protein product [Chrysoparadoxa australica]
MRSLRALPPRARAFRPWARAFTNDSTHPIRKIMIANRGEIACRVIRTARCMGIRTVAIYSDIDATALHVRMADEAVCVGPASSLESYLNVDRVLAAAHQTKADAVHPGYGFLSENAAFADRCGREGLAFIGPPSSAIKAMGDKIESKDLAARAGVNTIPGFEGAIVSASDAVEAAKDIGYPVMIKASAGGGGKGMRIAWSDEEVLEGFALSKQEAKSSFNDDRMLLEKFVVNSHHIEIQIMADSHGNVVAFPERECSVQRRNQKVIEESPSPFISASTRHVMQQQAIQLARAADYRSAGTVEMVCAQDQSFYFLEMNTRLQVEHPVTEAVSGVDLVEEMINVAGGLPLSQRLREAPSGCLPAIGHAFEARVYAEDPFRGFLPSTGPLEVYQEPCDLEAEEAHEEQEQEGMVRESIRVDSGVEEGTDVTMYYDPMISKVVSHAPDREAALAVLAGALDDYVIQGPRHNIPFLRDVTRNTSFAQGLYDTGFIPEHYPSGFSGVALTNLEQEHLAVAAVLIHAARDSALNSSLSGQVSSYDGVGQACYVAVMGHEAIHVTLADYSEEEQVFRGAQVTKGNVTTFVSIGNISWELESPLFSIELDNEERAIQYLRAEGLGYDLGMAGSLQHVDVLGLLEQELMHHMLPPPEEDLSRSLLCPMPGRIVSIAVVEGEVVEQGQELAVIEAMKMQNVLRAVQKGTVAKLYAAPGDSLQVLANLLTHIPTLALRLLCCDSVAHMPNVTGG